MSEKSLLLIDGSKASRVIIAKSINSAIEGLTINGCDSARAAFEQLQYNQYDLIITAMSLPDMQGQEFAEQLRNQHKNTVTPVIMMSGDFLQHLHNNTASPYINGYFDKSKGNHKLVEYVESYLSQHQWNQVTHGHVLYVEDSPTVTRVVTAMLKNSGYSYDHADNAADAFKLLEKSLDTNDEQKPFDLMLTDLQLEGLMSGCDLIREIRFGLDLSPDNFPILVSTSHNPDRVDHINSIVYAGCNDIIEKPVVESLLIARMSNLIRLKQCCGIAQSN